jgi:hypothetical protein
MIRIGSRCARSALVWCVACVLGWLATGASAQPAPALPPESDDTRPWAQGVSESEQAAAQALYVAGNQEFVESRYAEALAKYHESLRHWDHPQTRYNAGVCLMKLDQPEQARDHLARALAYGPTALGAKAYKQASTYLELLDTTLAHVKVACTERGAVVTLDGKYLFTAPGSADRFLVPGDHQIAATKPGFRSLFTAFPGVAGKLATYDLRLELDPSTGPPPARPWAHWSLLLGGGAVVAAAGGAVYLWARRDMKSYDAAVRSKCPDGCDSATHAYLDARKSRAFTKEVIAFSLMSAGGVGVITAALGLLIDQPRVRFEPSRASLAIHPSPDGAAVVLGGAF